MNAKEYLNEIKTIEAKARNKRCEIEQIYNYMQGVVGISYEPKIGGGSNSKSPQEKMIFKFIQYEEELDIIVNELLNKKKEAMKLIDKLKRSEHIEVLYKRYILNMKWEQISEQMNYTYRNVIKIHARALEEFEEINKEFLKVHKQ